MADVADYGCLERIANELSDRSLAGSLDFDTFRRLFAEARAASGLDVDALEMFCPFAKTPGWWEWMMEELRRLPSRVA